MRHSVYPLPRLRIHSELRLCHSAAEIQQQPPLHMVCRLTSHQLSSVPLASQEQTLKTRRSRFMFDSSLCVQRAKAAMAFFCMCVFLTSSVNDQRMWVEYKLVCGVNLSTVLQCWFQLASAVGLG